MTAGVGEVAGPERPSRQRAGRRIVDRRTDALLVLVVVVGFAPIVADNSAQPASRYSLTASFAEEHSVDLGRYAGALGLDRAVYGGELRSDKAPGQPLLGVPFYLVARAFGAEPATHLRVRGNLGLWWQTLWSATLPFAALLVLMRRTAARFAPRYALAATAAIGITPILLPHAVNLYGQVLAALLAFGAWLVVEPDAVSRRRLVAAGFLAGAAVTVEYHAAIVVLLLGVFCAWRAGRRGLWWLAGALPALGLLAWYQSAAFGSPLRSPYDYWAPDAPAELRIPGLSDLATVVGGGHGLILTSPVVLLALAGAAFGARSAGRTGLHCRVGLVFGICYWLLSAGWSAIDYTEDPGPRYMATALPFLALPLALVWQHWKVIAWGSTAIGGATALLASVTFVASPAVGTPLRAGLEHVARGEFAPTLWSMGLGWWGVALHGLTVAGVGLLAWRAWGWDRR